MAPKLPQITIQESTNSPVISISDEDGHPISPTLLSPTQGHGGGSSTNAPPSPTLSTGTSVHFGTATDLRNNHPSPSSGANSLQLLGPHYGHQRKVSIGTNPDTDETVIAHSSGAKGDGHEEDLASDPEHPKPERTPTIPHTVDPPDVEDPTPFAFSPNRVSGLVANNAKDIDALQAMGGTEGLLLGLGTNKDTGLSDGSLADAGGDGSPGAAGAPLSRRTDVYGHNVLPARKSKSLLLLMWLALKDKVLVRLFPSHPLIAR